MNNDLKYWVAVGSDARIGARTFALLLTKFKTMKQMWDAPSKELLNIGIPEQITNIISEIKRKNNPEKVLEQLIKLKINCVTIKDKNYPRLLAEIPNPPALLYYKGKLLPEDEVSLAVVGSRRFTSYGERITLQITRELAKAGLVIISGLALGIDSFAHKATLEAKGRTVAILGNGLDTIYPQTNRNLARQILENNGAIISEFPPKTQAMKFNFPIRNRIIAGMSLGTLITEGALKSGSLITAQCALEYNREVFAIPGAINSQMSEAPNHLIKSGAKLVTDFNDIINELNLDVKIQHKEAKKIIPDSKEEAIILENLNQTEAIHVDKLVKITKLDIATLNSKLTLMEIKGKIRNIGASNYVLGN